MKRKIVCMLMACLITLSVPVYAGSTTKLEDELNKQEQKKEKTQEQINDNEASMEKLQSEIEKLDKDISKVENEIASIQRDIDVTQGELDQTIAELEEAIEEKEAYKETLDERLRVMYMYSGTSKLEIVFSSSNFSDLISKMDVIKTIAEYDQEVFEILEALEKEIETKKEEIEIKKNNLIGMKKDSENKKTDLDKIRVTRNNVYAELKKNTQKLENDLAAIESESANIQSKINAIIAEKEAAEQSAGEVSAQASGGGSPSASAPAQQTTNGKYLWPVPGNHNISSSFGYRIHPVRGGKRFHAGIDITTGRRTGQNAVAAASGTVIDSRYSSSYGNMVVIDHGRDSNGNNVSSVYAHLASRYVGAGTRVSSGQAVGEVGTTGISTGIHLHFEIRINGNPVNPLNYVR